MRHSGHFLNLNGGIYAIVNRLSQRTYIGQVTVFNMRLNNHRSQLRMGKHRNKELQRDWREFGESAFEFRVLFSSPSWVIDETGTAMLTELEKLYLRGVESNTYNIATPVNTRLAIR